MSDDETPDGDRRGRTRHREILRDSQTIEMQYSTWWEFELDRSATVAISMEVREGDPVMACLTDQWGLEALQETGGLGSVARSIKFGTAWATTWSRICRLDAGAHVLVVLCPGYGEQPLGYSSVDVVVNANEAE